MRPSLFPSLLIAAGLTLIFVHAARAEDNSSTTIKFSDLTKPGTLKISVGHGDLHIAGVESSAGELTVKSDAQPVTSAPRKDGLRVITAA